MPTENISPKVKKVWQTPEVYLLATNPLNGGTAAGLNENLIISSSTLPAGRFILFKSVLSAGIIKTHSWHHYSS